MVGGTGGVEGRARTTSKSNRAGMGTFFCPGGGRKREALPGVVQGARRVRARAARLLGLIGVRGYCGDKILPGGAGRGEQVVRPCQPCRLPLQPSSP